MYAHTQTSTSKGSGRQRVHRTCFHCAPGFATPKLAHMLDSLVRVSRRGDQKHFVVGVRRRGRVQSTMSWSFPATPNGDDLRSDTVRWSRRPSGRWPSANTACDRFLLSDFRHSLTLFSKFFASFPHGTCSLSVSHPYLALDGVYHLLELHSQATRLVA